MAENYHSLHNDENSQYKTNGGSMPTQPISQQQQPLQLVSLTAAAKPTAKLGALSTLGKLGDYNNNNNNANNTQSNMRNSTSMRCFGTQLSTAGSGFTGHLVNNNNNSNIKTSSGNYVVGAPGCDPHTSVMATNNAVISCQYAHANGSATCYNRNRYMPYNHNRVCAAAAAAVAATGQPLISHHYQHQQHHHNHNNNNNHQAIGGALVNCGSGNVTTSATFNYQQQFGPIYQQSNCLGLSSSTGLPQSVSSGTLQSHQASTAAPFCGTVISSNVTSACQFPNFVCGSSSSVAGQCATTNTVFANSAPSALDAVSNAGSITSTDTNYGSSATPIVIATNMPNVSLAYNNTGSSAVSVGDTNETVTLQITNLDYSLDETSLRNFLLNQLKPITPVVALVFEGSSYAKVTVPDLYFAKQVVSNLHRKKVGHKRMLVSYTRDSSLTEINTLRCQVAGLLKDVPYYTLPMYKFRELFQSRFKTSISVLDLYKMQDICTINSDNNEDKFISLQPDLVNSLESSPLMEGLQHSVPYCTVHFKRAQHKGWAEQDIEPLPNVCMTITEIQQIIYPLLKHHPGDIPVATLIHCIEGELKVQIAANESGVNLEHLVCCVQGIQIQVNNFGIKILELIKEYGAGTVNNNTSNLGSSIISSNGSDRNGGGYSKNSTVADPLYQISREVIELVKTSPKSTMKFNRFIPAYHNHFGKQCRVADYGYTKLIELFEALSSVVQIMGDGENRQITLTHRTQIRRFTSDLLRVLRAHGNNSVLLSQLPSIFAQTQNRHFDVTDYGVCDIVDILDGLVNSNIVVVSSVDHGNDVLISIPKRRQTNSELEKTCIFAGEMVELFRNALQYSILFQKFVRSYHYHFAYQCRLSDYGFLKLADLMDAIHGVVEMEVTNDEDKKIYLSPIVARRVFAEQCEELIRNVTGSSMTCMKLDQVLKLHKKKYGYQILPQTLGVKDIHAAIELLPFVELEQKEGGTIWITCHNNDAVFRTQCYRACKHLLQRETRPEVTSLKQKAAAVSSSSSSSGNEVAGKNQKIVPQIIAPLSMSEFIVEYNAKHKNHLTKSGLKAMKNAIELYKDKESSEQLVRLSSFSKFLIAIVRLIEQRSTMCLNELKNALDCGVTRTFEFGYPNLYTLIAAYPDLFALNVGPSQERSDVSLTSNCELRQSSSVAASTQPLFGSIKLSYGKQKSNRGSREPLGEHNNRSSANQPPPHKTRALSNDFSATSNTAVSVAANVNVNHKLQIHNNNVALSNGNNIGHYQHNKKFAQMATTVATQPICHSSPPYMCNSSSCNQNFSNMSIYSTASHQSSLLNTSSSNVSMCSGSNKENSLNGSLQFFNSSFNSSYDLNSSICSNAPLQMCSGNTLQQSGSLSAQNYSQSNKLWNRRQINYFQQQQPQSMLSGLMMQQPLSQAPAIFSQATPANLANTSDSIGLYELVSNMPMCAMFEPPKPDTPPSENIPYWIDPIWTNNNLGDEPTNKSNLLNIRLPELKALEVLPNVLSPYTLSKTENMKQKMFNFDNHDRKIA